jgi:peptidoglycan/xylan/chitin deacetylase (PgdA/CDA1 family)
MPNPIALRIDDIGASTKFFERYSKQRLLNFGILRHRRLFGAWGPYREMTAGDWHEVFGILRTFRAKLTVAITACWVERDGSLVPFPEKFPDEAAAIKAGVSEGLVEIASHGLTHCVLKDFLFKPRLWGSNRTYHREFWSWIPEEAQRESLRRSMEILSRFFEKDVLLLVPPGNVFSEATVRCAGQLGFKIINCSNPKLQGTSDLRIFGNENVITFHDRELVLNGVHWLSDVLSSLPLGREFCFVSEI